MTLKRKLPTAILALLGYALFVWAGSAAPPAESGPYVVVASYPNTPDFAKVGDRIQKILVAHKIDVGFPASAGVSVDVPASKANEALVLLARAMKAENLPIRLTKLNDKGDRYVEVSPESVLKETTARKLINPSAHTLLARRRR